MTKRKVTKDALQLLHSDKRVMEILTESNDYLARRTDVKEKIMEYNWILRSLSGLIPETVEKFWSGHIFPITEAEYELEASIVFCKLGFYKHAISSLRNVLELGLLSVYWDIDDTSHIEIQNWLKSRESTPFKKEVFKRLKKNGNIKILEEKQRIFAKTATLYEKLSNFSHTHGMGYSSRGLNAHSSNVNSFNEGSLNKWLGLMREVVEVVAIFHVMKYPVGLQDTPIEEKFGLNGPVGGFLEPGQVDRIRKLVSTPELLKTLQEISDNDKDANLMVEWVNSHPDVTEAELSLQVEEQEKRFIEWEGFPHWAKNQMAMCNHLKMSKPHEYKAGLEFIERMKLWATENGFLKKGKNLNSRAARK